MDVLFVQSKEIIMKLSEVLEEISVMKNELQLCLDKEKGFHMRHDYLAQMDALDKLRTRLCHRNEEQNKE